MRALSSCSFSLRALLLRGLRLLLCLELLSERLRVEIWQIPHRDTACFTISWRLDENGMGAQVGVMAILLFAILVFCVFDLEFACRSVLLAEMTRTCCAGVLRDSGAAAE